MKLFQSTKSNKAGYTIVEALVGVSLLMMAVAAAASMSMTMVTQEELNARGARGMNWHENAVRLFQLGVGGDNDAAPIEAILPGLPQFTSIAATTTAQTFAALPTGDDQIGVTTITVVYASDLNGTTTRSNSMTAVRY